MKDLKITNKTIDIEKIIQSKSKKLYRFLPRFLINYLKNILHEQDLNAYLFKNKDLFGIDFATAILKDFGCKIDLEGEDRIRPEGRFILASNHPLGGLDGMAIISAVGKIRKNILFPVNDFLMALPNLRPIFIPINKIGNNTENHHALQQAFASDATLLFFPAGLCSRKQKNGLIRDLPWKKTFVTQAKETHRDIIPVFIDGNNSNFFHNLARWRVRLKLKFNIEQAFLVNEMFKQRGQHIKIIVGKAIPYEILDNQYSDMQWAQLIQTHVYRLQENKDIDFVF